jgi:hypothetical protein
MQTKPNSLRAAMLGVQQADTPHAPSVSSLPPATPIPVTAPKTVVAASRIGKRSISGHVAPEVQKQLRRLAVDLDRSHQNLLDEALNDLFRKYNVSAIA